MKRIYYAGTSIVTGDELAEALLGYAQALASNRTSASVEIPILLPEGTTGSARVVLGSASEMVAVVETVRAADIQDAELLAQLLSLTRELGSPSPRESGSEHVAPIQLDDLL
jgi:hypothetical protein